ncbi:hypothetical protein KP509_10G036000 [Ceratopteris richardii]|uniref:FAS1 domain-containing protein n=1 Tax=Ceratopteris richardii TaxID=49495 RepID=A0A8T2U096_CERRI|nr:hypothetical protein KP509_10G036000 [Ceratopteris richardii]
MEVPVVFRFELVLSLALAMTIATAAQAPAPAPSPSLSPAPAPAPAFANITQVLINAGDYATLVGYLTSTGVGEKFQAQANRTDVGITIFAPKNKAFTTNPAASLLKGISFRNLEALLEYHALNNWESLADLQQMTDNVTSTFATYNSGGRYQLNITNVQGQVQVDTEWNRATIASTLYNAQPVSIFALDEVLLPTDIFGLPAPAPAPAPSSGAPTPGPSSSSSPSSSSAGGAASGPSGGNSFATHSSSPATVFSLLLLALLMKIIA